MIDIESYSGYWTKNVIEYFNRNNRKSYNRKEVTNMTSIVLLGSSFVLAIGGFILYIKGLISDYEVIDGLRRATDKL